VREFDTLAASVSLEEAAETPRVTERLVEARQELA
jgi:hypothetical protein